MSSRSTETTVTFTHPFLVKGLDGLQPPGTYLVVTEEERLENLSFPAWHRTGTQLHLPAIATASATRQAVTIDPADLAAALIADGRPGAGPADAAPSATATVGPLPAGFGRRLGER
ncbi:MAG: hypothetical protein OJJ21_06690 [Ferrovibrio sp.]|uniref:hypothetical protein n=1 Tax=Ferrovibrio sp. TaxID=1917215 RepID=UPI0026385308|nr:hypothetical protein [Ferrovibrio sp.]MCW0233266.1 hypothetical protein [Ferrovibrio sp.]